MDFLTIKNETEEEFFEIAQILFDKYAIQTHNSIFRLAEIEFYWNSPTHIDNSTYNRKYVDPKAGDWFFHYSGVDIALKNEETGGYGGILIRSIYDTQNKVLYRGPMICAMKLFSENSAFNQIRTSIIPFKFSTSTVVNGLRAGLGQNAKVNGADKLNYSFKIDPVRD